MDRGRPGFGARLEIDRLNLDAYAPDLTGVSDTGEPHVLPEGVAKPDLAGWLAGFDANLNADIGTLTVAGVPVQQAKLDGTLTNGTLAVRQFRTSDLAGIAGSIQGSIGKLQPLDDMELTVDLKAASLAQLIGHFRRWQTAGSAFRRTGWVKPHSRAESPAIRSGWRST